MSTKTTTTATTKRQLFTKTKRITGKHNQTGEGITNGNRSNKESTKGEGAQITSG